MQGGKLTISRGMPSGGDVVPIRREPEQRQPPAAPPAAVRQTEPGPAPDYHLIHFRLAALEQLSQLRDKGALSAEEFAAEKALILRLPAREPAAEAMPPPRGPSLLGRLLNWKILTVGAIAGLAISAATAPKDLFGLIDQASRLVG